MKFGSWNTSTNFNNVPINGSTLQCHKVAQTTPNVRIEYPSIIGSIYGICLNMLIQLGSAAHRNYG